jgi:hypothetical protein
MVDKNNQLLFVQFIHPGKEHTPDKNNQNYLDWNKGSHKRKFLKNSGTYLEGDRQVKSDLGLIFWGEWEAQSNIQQLKVARKGEPQYLYEPYYVIPKNYQNLQNTDPFVFGDNFYYVCCKQATKRGPTQLRYLESGSVIVFGSCSNKQFVLDTVFVVDRYYNIESLKQISQHVPDTYTDVTLKCIYSCIKKNKNNCTANPDFRLYIGATFDKPKNGMFSFFPCLPSQKNSNQGFIRPVIKIPNAISDGLTQGLKFNRDCNIPKLWQKVKSQVEQANLKLGIYTKLPSQKSTIQ